MPLGHMLAQPTKPEDVDRVQVSHGRLVKIAANIAIPYFTLQRTSR